MGHPAPASSPLGESWLVKTAAQRVRYLRGPQIALTSAGGWPSCLSAGYFHPKSVEGLRSDVRVRRRPSVPRRRRACYACVSMPLCPLGKSCPPIILHGPKLSLEFTAGSLVCSLGSFIIRFCKRMLVAKAFLFEQLLDFFLCFIKPILVFSGRQTSSLVFICFHCPSCSAAVKQ